MDSPRDREPTLLNSTCQVHVLAAQYTSVGHSFTTNAVSLRFGACRGLQTKARMEYVKTFTNKSEAVSQIRVGSPLETARGLHIEGSSPFPMADHSVINNMRGPDGAAVRPYHDIYTLVHEKTGYAMNG